MLLIQILLAIIAIGVLLASKEGRAFLGIIVKFSKRLLYFLAILLVIVGLLYLGFRVAVFAIWCISKLTGSNFWQSASIFILGILTIIVLAIGSREIEKQKGKNEKTDAGRN